MTTPIHPEALKTYRARKHWTQEQLADATQGPSRVSLPTIKRVESTKGSTYPANDRVAEVLAKALGVSIEDLSRGPSEAEDREESLRKFGYRPLRTMVDAETALAFNMVQHIYGIPIRSQIEMAPLFVALLAEGSLACDPSASKPSERRLQSSRNWAVGSALSFTLLGVWTKEPLKSVTRSPNGTCLESRLRSRHLIAATTARRTILSP